MWIFTTYGFFSAVCARQADGGHRQPVSLDRMMIRARRRQHLDRLIAHFPKLLTTCEIQESTSTDYRFRVFVAKEAWAEVLKQLAMETDYDNFKSAVAKQLSGSADGDQYEEALHDVWDVMYGSPSR